MKNKTLNFYLILITVLSSFPLGAQDIHFSQYTGTPLMINPAFAGEFEGNGRFMMNYRNQWSAVTNNPYTTYDFAYDRNFMKEILAAGITAFKDKAGDGNMGIAQLNLIFASKVSIGRNDFLKMGINGSWTQQSVQFSNLTWNSQYDGQTINPDINSGEIFSGKNFSYVDFSTGILLIHKYKEDKLLHVGISAYHAARSNNYFLNTSCKLKIRWSGHVDMKIVSRDKKMTAFPSMIMTVQGPFTEICAGSVIGYKFNMGSRYTGYYKPSFGYLGAYYRYRDAFIFYAGIQYKNQVNIGISYDMNASRLIAASQTRGGLEISLSYLIPDKALIELE